MTLSRMQSVVSGAIVSLWVLGWGAAVYEFLSLMGS